MSTLVSFVTYVPVEGGTGDGGRGTKNEKEEKYVGLLFMQRMMIEAHA